MPPHLVLKKKEYTLIKVQRSGLSAIYKNTEENTYLRIGDKTKIEQDILKHQQIESLGFPIAKFLEKGTHNEFYYYKETSLGEETLSEVLKKESEENGFISDATFTIFLSLVEKFARTQLKRTGASKDFTNFSKAIHLDVLCEELPDYAQKIKDTFLEITQRLLVFPFVITHGDFNPHNMYPEGIIDFEDSFLGPFGYDLISTIVHIEYFPTSKEYENFATYAFTEEQKQKYLNHIDRICIEHNLPQISLFKKDFDFCRAVWLLVKMQNWPKLQSYRYDLFIQKFLINKN